MCFVFFGLREVPKVLVGVIGEKSHRDTSMLSSSFAAPVLLLLFLGF